MEEAIRCYNLTKKYLSLSARVQITALSNFQMSIDSSTLTALVGNNGSGKSTVLRILATLIRPSSGTAEIYSRARGKYYDIKKKCKNVREEIGFLPENPLFYSTISASAILRYLGRLRGHKNIKERVIELLDRFRLNKWADIPVGVFSHGMRQRLGLATTLIHEPSILLLDEPFQGLDIQSIGEITAILREEQSEYGRTVLYSTHDPRLVKEADNCIKMA
ncbi:MAG: ABC transporter ATP-binding protein [Candidatus Hodarchaeales archaeon]|jgi:ABC-2 type transport system ATP-binding protein